MIKLDGENGENNTNNSLLLGPAKSAAVKTNKLIETQNALLELQKEVIEGQKKILKQQEDNENLIKRVLTLIVVLIILAFITLSFVIIK